MTRLMQRRGIVSVLPGVGGERCWAKPVGKVESKHLRQTLYQSGLQLIDNYQKVGLEYYNQDGIHVYGPFPTASLLMPMLDHETMAVTEEEAKALLLEVDSSPVFSNYLLVANFISRAEITVGKARSELTPAPKEELTNG